MRQLTRSPHRWTESLFEITVAVLAVGWSVARADENAERHPRPTVCLCAPWLTAGDCCPLAGCADPPQLPTYETVCRDDDAPSDGKTQSTVPTKLPWCADRAAANRAAGQMAAAATGLGLSACDPAPRRPLTTDLVAAARHGWDTGHRLLDCGRVWLLGPAQVTSVAGPARLALETTAPESDSRPPTHRPNAAAAELAKLQRQYRKLVELGLREEAAEVAAKLAAPPADPAVKTALFVENEFASTNSTKHHRVGYQRDAEGAVFQAAPRPNTWESVRANRISFHFQGSSVKEVAQFFHFATGLTVRVAPAAIERSASGIHVLCRDKPIDEALAIALGSVGLTCSVRDQDLVIDAEPSRLPAPASLPPGRETFLR